MVPDTDENVGPLLDPGGGPSDESLVGIYDGDDDEPLDDEQLSLDDGLNEWKRK